jgi:excisionase family DNA binding protein
MNTNHKEIKSDYLDTIEAAEYLHISKAQIYRMIKSRKIPFYKISSKILLKISDIEDFMYNNRIASVDETMKKIMRG